jgi:hypothetical protein
MPLELPSYRLGPGGQDELAPWAGSPGKTGIERDQPRVEEFRQGHVPGVVKREGATQRLGT